jgi:hypothetical protein
MEKTLIEQIAVGIGDIRINNGVFFEGEDIDLSIILQNHPSIVQVIQKAGVDPKNLKVLGSGDRGTAFSDGGDIIVKITTDLKEAFASHNVIGKKIPGIANIHYAAVIRQHPEDPEQFYLVIQDRVPDLKLSQTEKYIAGAIGEYLVELKRWPFDIKAARKTIYNELYMKTNQSFIGPVGDKMITQILAAVTNLYNAGVMYFDVSSENVGKDKQGNYIVFDLGISNTQRADLPVIEGIDPLYLPTI